MLVFQPIAPKEPESTLLRRSDVARTRARHQHTAMEWEEVRQQVIQLYIKRNMTAESVMLRLKNDLAFETRYVLVPQGRNSQAPGVDQFSSRRALFVKLKEWGIWRNCRGHQRVEKPPSTQQSNSPRARSLLPMSMPLTFEDRMKSPLTRHQSRWMHCRRMI